MYDRIFKKKPNIVSMEWGRDFLRIFTPSNGRCTTEIYAWCIHGLMIQKMKNLIFFECQSTGAKRGGPHCETIYIRS
jgi:hypothetical protein